MAISLIMFWNLENYFDPFEGQTGNEYTPTGEKHWTWKKFCAKRDLISKIILSTRDEYLVFPSIIGVCEVENLFVLEQLTKATQLNALGYKILHRNSIDRRGIDVALLYREEKVEIIEEEYFPHSDTLLAYNLKTRYVLYTKCVIKKAEGVEGLNDTLHIFVNHWPSKLKGDQSLKQSNLPQLSPRMFIAAAVRAKCDSILYFNPDARIVLMGDFNDTPDSEPIRYLCIGEHSNKGDSENSAPTIKALINLTETQSKHNWGIGSYKFKDKWEAIDQFIVSDSIGMKMSVFTHSALMKDDKNYLGKQINRTLKGPRYIGGASDHLPIMLRIEYNQKSRE